MKRQLKTILICSVLITGCKKFLTQEVPGVVVEDQFYKTDADIQQAVIAVYDMMQAHYNNNWGSLYMIKTLLSDESNAGGGDAGDQPGYQTIDKYNFDATNDKIRDAWRMCYFTIYRANKVINKTIPENEVRTRLIGEAKFLRAYNYFELVSLWGDVPLVLDDIAPADYTKTGRKAKSVVYAQIEKDLLEAIGLLPVKSALAAADKFRASKGAAQALLGKTYLYEQKWPEAVAQFEAVINSNQFTLASSVGKVFSHNDEFGEESLFEISYANNRNYDWGNFPWTGQPESNIHIQLMGPRGDWYSKAPSDSLIAGWGFNVPTKKLWDAFIAAGDVNRRKQSIMSKAELVANGGNWTNDAAWGFEGYLQRKYGSFSTQTGGPINELNYGTNWRQIRYADVLLMASEVQYRIGHESKSRLYLNAVRQRSGLSDVSSSGAALFDAIVKERQLELAFEGFRFTDLVRWGLAKQELGPLGFNPSKHSLLPIPDYDVRTAALTQNPGW
ncbi:MAG: RagB/SusD family nutrient uptake outer membrane protein [Flavisolibacter sp.]